MIFIEPPHAGPAGQPIGRRRLLTFIRYPLARTQAAPQPAAGPFPLLMFAPGFMQCAAPYARLLQAWASAGYVVAVVNFPRTDCHAGDAYEADLVNQPADMSYVISRLLAVSAQPNDLFSGMLNRHEIAATGQSDGGDTVAALAASACCADRRLVAVASVQLYRADSRSARYYLDLFGANHMVPYVGTNPVERLVARVTLAFFDRYVLGQATALATMTRDGNVAAKAALVTGRLLPP